MNHFLRSGCTILLFFSLQQAIAMPDTMLVRESVMVTIEEHFGAGVHSVGEALAMIERKYEPFDHEGRTFAILDAFGNQMPDGKMHLSMHISSEKAGYARLVHAGSGKILWECHILPGKDGNSTAGARQLNIYIERESEKDKYYTVDGSGNPASIFECILNETRQPVKDYWQDQSVREFIFIYSACGCPVHAKFKRNGNRSEYLNSDQVIFPDDEAVLSVIRRLMGW